MKRIVRVPGPKCGHVVSGLSNVPNPRRWDIRHARRRKLQPSQSFNILLSCVIAGLMPYAGFQHGTGQVCSTLQSGSGVGSGVPCVR